MKRLGSSDSLGAFISICPTKDEDSPRMDHIYSREFQSMLDGLDEQGCVVEESGGGHVVAEKKRRLSVDQVKSLERNFEVENKLEPDRKLKLAQELGLQPRQVAVWFQNRRARWKTKQLERDYGLLKTSYDSLKADFDTLHHDNEALLKEIRELKAKLDGDQSSTSNLSVKEEVILPETDYKTLEQSEAPPMATSSDPPPPELNYESASNNNNGNGSAGGATTLFPDLKDGSSDSTDSSGILNEDNINNNNNGGPNCGAISSSVELHSQQHLLMSATRTSSSLNFNSSSSSSSSSLSLPASMNCFQFSKTTSQPQQYVKMEEHNFFSTADEACNFFAEEQAPSLHWYCSEQWN